MKPAFRVESLCINLCIHTMVVTAASLGTRACFSMGPLLRLHKGTPFAGVVYACHQKAHLSSGFMGVFGGQPKAAENQRLWRNGIAHDSSAEPQRR